MNLAKSAEQRFQHSDAARSCSVFASDDYELLDFGAGRKLERFGPYLLDRPCPAADDAAPSSPARFGDAVARYHRDDAQRGQWTCKSPIGEPWPVRFGPLTMELKLTESGQLGVFPEQVSNWQWIFDEVRKAGHMKLLNLFAYTGSSTLAAAAAGAEVVHVDAAGGIVDWARRNAEASNLGDAPTRWIVEDAVKFARRELKRGNRYDGLILDPPAYGHGPHGRTWQLARDLDELLMLALELLGDASQLLLLSCHSGRLSQPNELQNCVIEQSPALADCGTLWSGQMCLVSPAGRRLQCGAAVRWSRSAA